MAYHPDFRFTYNCKPGIGGWKTSAVRSRSGTRQARSDLSTGFRVWQVELDWLTQTDTQTLMDFFDARKGAYEKFYWFSFMRTSRTDFAVGTGDGVVTVFNLPFKLPASPPTIKKAGVTQTSGVDYTYSAGGGPGGEDKITFTSAPANGAAITATFTTARERHQVVFGTDQLDPAVRLGDGLSQYQFAYALEEVP